MKFRIRCGCHAILAAIVLIAGATASVPTSIGFAAGGTAQLIIGEEARRGVRDRGVRDRLEEEMNAFQHGTLHPDLYRQAFELINAPDPACDCTEDRRSSDDGHIRKPNPCGEKVDGACESPGGEEAEHVPNWVNTCLEAIDLDDRKHNFKKLAFLYGPSLTSLRTPTMIGLRQRGSRRGAPEAFQPGAMDQRKGAGQSRPSGKASLHPRSSPRSISFRSGFSSLSFCYSTLIVIVCVPSSSKRSGVAKALSMSLKQVNPTSPSTM